MQGVIDLGAAGGLKQQPYGDPNGAFVQHSTNDPLVCNTGSVGFNIAQMEDRFPNYVELLRDLPIPFTDTEILQRTYPTCLYNEYELKNQGGYAGFGFNGRTPIYMPPGVWHINSELRSGQHRNMGGGKGFNAGAGATVIQISATNWKSIHGAQNNGMRIAFHNWTYAGEQSLTPQPISVGGGAEYMHFFTVEEMTIQGTATTSEFWSPAKTEIGVMMENAGERCDVKETYMVALSIPVLISGNTARPKVMNSSLFYNTIAGVAMRGGALSEIIFSDLSCDNNPYVLLQFRAGSNIFGTGPFLPSAQAGVPGGVVTFDNVKTESFACRAGYLGMSACQGPTVGKGGMWAMITGRTYFNARNCTLNVHNGRIWSAVEVLDQDAMNNAFPSGGYAGGFQLDNSEVRIKGSKMNGVQNWMADWGRQRVHPRAGVFSDDDILDFNWINKFNGVVSAAPWSETPTGKFLIPTTTATYRGTQPFINQNQILTWTGGAPGAGFNYHPVTGVNF